MVLTVGIAAIAGCQKTGYVISGNTVAYYAKQPSGFTVKHPIPDVDVKTFQTIAQNYARNKNRIYRFLSPLEAADPKTFEILDDNYYARDRQHVYAGNTWISHDVPNFQRLDSAFSKDSQHVYSLDRQLPDADPGSFTIPDVPGGGYSKDSKQVFKQAKTLPGANLATFRPLNTHYSKDNKPVSCVTQLKVQILEDATLISFTVLQDHLAKDNQHVYYAGQPIIPILNHLTTELPLPASPWQEEVPQAVGFHL